MVNDLLLSIGEGVAQFGVAGLAHAMSACKDHPQAVAGALGKIAVGAWNKWREKKKEEKKEREQDVRDKQLADVLAAARLSYEEVKVLARVIAERVTPDPELQVHVERFVTLVPASIRASLRHKDDLTGHTFPPKHAGFRDAEDLVKLFPVRLPRFKAGDTPPFLRGWRLVEQIGAGGFGEVWKVQNSHATNLVRAVKFGHGLSDAEQSLLNEGNVLNRLLAEGQHDGVVKLLDVWAVGDPVPWLQYEYIAGGDLAAVITVWQSLPVELRVAKVLATLVELTATVAHFHALRPFIVHRDLKPSNILYDPKAGRFKITDFGIGGVSSHRMLHPDVSVSQTVGTMMASIIRGAHTPLYASEQQRNGGPLDPRDDVHALGVIAYQMLTGKLGSAPGTDVDDDMAEHGSPAELVALVKACTAREPNRRPKDAGEVLERLKAVPVPEIPVAPPEPVLPVTAEPVVEPTPSDSAGVGDVTQPAGLVTETRSHSVWGGFWGKVKGLFGSKEGERPQVDASTAVAVAEEAGEEGQVALVPDATRDTITIAEHDTRYPPEPPTDGPAAEYAAWRQGVERQRQQASQAAKEYDYAQAVTHMERVPAQHRDQAALKEWKTKRDRLALLWDQVLKHNRELPEAILIGRLEEILVLNPNHSQAKCWLSQFSTNQRYNAKPEIKCFREFERAGGKGGGPIKVSCPNCSGVIYAPSDSAGKRGRCPTCGNILSIHEHDLSRWCVGHAE